MAAPASASLCHELKVDPATRLKGAAVPSAGVCWMSAADAARRRSRESGQSLDSSRKNMRGGGGGGVSAACDLSLEIK